MLECFPSDDKPNGVEAPASQALEVHLETVRSMNKMDDIH